LPLVCPPILVRAIGRHVNPGQQPFPLSPPHSLSKSAQLDGAGVGSSDDFVRELVGAGVGSADDFIAELVGAGVGFSDNFVGELVGASVVLGTLVLRRGGGVG